MVRALARVGGLVGLFIVGFIGMSMLRPPGAAAPGFSEPGLGKELAVVLLVSTTCRWSNDPDLVPAWTTLVDRIRDAAPDSIDRVTTVGVVMAPTPTAGFEFLSRFGEFHEITAGRRLNNGMLRYVVQDFRGPTGVPQVAVVYREFAEREDGSIHRSSEVVMQRIFGLAGIREAPTRIPVIERSDAVADL